MSRLSEQQTSVLRAVRERCSHSAFSRSGASGQDLARALYGLPPLGALGEMS